jgi:hypothetical protein
MNSRAALKFTPVSAQHQLFAIFINMSTERPTLPDEVVALFEGSDQTTLIKFAGDHAVQAAIREMLAARTARQRELALAMARLASQGNLPTSNFSPGTQLVLELSARKHPGIIRTITTSVVDMGLHRIQSDVCADDFEPVRLVKPFDTQAGDSVHICSRDFGPTGELEPLLQVSAGLGVLLIKQGTSRPSQVAVRPNGEQSSIPLVLERLVADDVQIIPPISNADAWNGQVRS